MLEAIASRHMGRVVRAFRRHPFHGRSLAQGTVGRWLEKTQPQVSRLEKGPMVQSLDQLCFVARRLRIPPELLWFELPDSSSNRRAWRAAPADDLVGDRATVDLANQTDGGYEAFSGTAVAAAIADHQLAEVARFAAALEEAAQGKQDVDLVGYLTQQLEVCAAEDTARGARAALPLTLGVVGGIELVARSSSATVRKGVLATGARAAEFAGWLYRDLAVPTLAEHWRDRAMEWAQTGGDLSIQGYVLLRKAQAAWDQRDTFRMLTLAEAVRDGPWRLPAAVRAEALQQAARAEAMLGGAAAAVDARLQDAAEVLDAATPTFGGAGQVDSRSGSPLLALQTAICQREAAYPERAVELYEANLRPEWFSRRDYGYFRALMAFALADIDQPDEASEVGMEALAIAMDTGSARTIGELHRLRARLDPWANRSSVHDFARAVPAAAVSGFR